MCWVLCWVSHAIYFLFVLWTAIHTILICTVKYEWWLVCKQVFWNAFFILVPLKKWKWCFCHKLIAFLCLKFSILYMLFLSLFCSNLKHDQIGLECKVYNIKLGLHVVVNMCKSVANIANLISFSFTTSGCRVDTKCWCRWLNNNCQWFH